MSKGKSVWLAFMAVLLLMTNIVFLVQFVRVKDATENSFALTRNEYESNLSSYKNELEEITLQLSLYKNAYKKAQEDYKLLLEEKDKLVELNGLMEPAYNNWVLFEQRYKKTDRSGLSREKLSLENLTAIRMRVTAYTEYECGKAPDHPLFGITASGNRVREWFTAAAGKELPFGTRIYIPYFKDEPNGGIFVVEDRGSAIKENCIDVYIPDQNTVDQFGCKWLDVYVLE